MMLARRSTAFPYVWVVASLVILVSGCVAGPGPSAPAIRDIHGLALDPQDSTRLYVATHHGLFVGRNDGDWQAVTVEPFDMMGFTMHPKDARIMYASGHPGRAGQGWAVGVVKSVDAGRTWTTLALKNEVDFHAMTMQPGADAASDRVYGFHAGKLHVSENGGHTWQQHTVPFTVAALAAHPTTGQVYAATDRGLLRNEPALQGSWTTVLQQPGLSVATTEDQTVVYVASTGLAKSLDAGSTWSSLNWTVPAGDFPWGIALDAKDPDTIYVGTARGTIHKTTDAGSTWTRVR